ncbi:hypothetical protein EGW08_008834 [Elysia chlorotica]|uniref:Uncharacterized protein n=1 Tax=Elysia chlorotica TaxID=188477 RepID=A0A433TP86_ELYCH|nr:hypothetical protein EGW08_008834 [Elysia chlorotica]
MLTQPLAPRWWTCVSCVSCVSCLSRVVRRPPVLLSVSLIGCLMLWLASKQVKSTVQVLADLQVLGPGQVNRLPDRPRYCLFGLLTLAFVWLDLLVVKKLGQSATTLLAWARKMLGAAHKSGSRPQSCESQRAAQPVRKNPVRSCRATSRQFWGFEDKADL